MQLSTSFLLGRGSRPPSCNWFELGGGSRPPSCKWLELGGGSEGVGVLECTHTSPLVTAVTAGEAVTEVGHGRYSSYEPNLGRKQSVMYTVSMYGHLA